ncbi:hydrogenase expression/formation protein HypE [Candidatus Thorarchaeota archaeon]|nr:MAG: hydrogenase expression/formation protein HypE [Candidatus Thorarchaeota archaeon]
MTKIETSHGAGGKIMQRLLEEVIIPSFSRRHAGDIGLDEMDDGATLKADGKELVVCTDAHTIQPLFFPGGDIGKLTACGTINDVAVMGARPIAMTNTIIVEEGFEIATLKTILESLNEVIDPLGVAMIAGDTKVMPRGTIDQLVMSTSGIGVVYGNHAVTDSGAQPGDLVIATGPVGDHGTTLLAHREGLEFDTNLTSDVAALWLPIRDCLDIGGVHSMKDPTRGGTAVALNEIASKSHVEMEIDERSLPIRPGVKSLCGILGLDPLHMSCEGTVVMSVAPSKADELLEALAKHSSTAQATIVGRVLEGKGRVVMKTGIGGKKIIQVPYGEPVPRVC